MTNLISSYFNWLQHGAPTGEVVRYPVIREKYQSQVDGLYIVGDLSGLPLLKFAAKQGFEVIGHIATRLAQSPAPTDDSVYDVAILGAGAAGLAAALHAKRQGLRYVVLEGVRIANTIVNFPKGKPIFAEPMQIANPSELPVVESTKEETLATWFQLLDREQLSILEGMNVRDVRKNQDGVFEVTVEDKPAVKARFIVLATGKAGKSRTLNVPGEKLPKVSDRLFSPLDYRDQNILVVGGGDSAIETAIALAETGNNVTISYRKGDFSRIKEGNARQLETLFQAGKVTVLYHSTVKEITETSVVLQIGKETRRLPNDVVFTMIGKELPYEFLERLGITIENTWTAARFALFGLSVFVFSMVYFGKSVAGKLTPAASLGAKIGVLVIPGLTVIAMMATVLYVYWTTNRHKLTNFQSLVPPLLTAVVTTGITLLSLFLVCDHVGPDGKPAPYKLLGLDQYFWYSALYSLAILVFGIRRIVTRKNDYITRQTISLIFFQVVMLFGLPYGLEFGVKGGFLHLPNWMETYVFPNQSYSNIYGLVLAYPLYIHNVLTGEPSAFWLGMSILQTFVIIPALIYYFGKGAYCGWICSCGALAETLGDDYRMLAPHGEKAKRWENLGQVILAAIVLITILWALGHWTPEGSVFRTARLGSLTLAKLSLGLKNLYSLVVDVAFAGAIPLAVYFFYSGRIWCRYGCPLAALMHIYTKFSRYRIFSDKKKCISCNICTKVCHMGIDVMGYASQGRPMDDVECVRCSACVVSCPMDVLSFGQTGTGHPHDPGPNLVQLRRVRS
ncbi:MAG TPA: NAD(P)-binding domain-containing protein [Acidobacteriota bacterium]|nr:NAD(P)-binding domain-containing protein [Acidobacteriota bacterium]